MPCSRAGLLACCAVICLATVPADAAGVKLAESGSTLMLPLLQSWAAAYAKAVPDVEISTAGTDSGAGIAAAEAGSAQFGASDAYMSDVDVMQHPGVLDIPLAISAQIVAYNLPGLTAPLRLSGPVLAAIYAGTVHDWSDPQVAALNPGVTLPSHAIVPVRRSDTAGDTFIFTQFLTFSTPSWEAGIGYGTSVPWPAVAGSVTAAGNAGMVQALAQTPFSVGYVGGSFASQLEAAKLGTALLQNEAGKFVLPTPDGIAAAAAALTPRTPADERLTLAFAPGEASYPLINYEYAIVAKQSDPAVATALRNFRTWTVTPGQGATAAYLDPGHFIALPTPIRGLTELQIAKIH
jgi:phosphate transport system substrate-binding protein